MLYKLNSDFNITTSRKPSQITRKLAQFLRHYFKVKYINRGKSSFTKVVNETANDEKSFLVVINETKGNPSSINIFNVDDVKNAWISLYISVSIPNDSNTINTNPGEIVLINKSREYDQLCDNLTPFESIDKIRENCIILSDDDKTYARFIDKKGLDTGFKLYMKGFKIND